LGSSQAYREASGLKGDKNECRKTVIATVMYADQSEKEKSGKGKGLNVNLISMSNTSVQLLCVVNLLHFHTYPAL